MLCGKKTSPSCWSVFSVMLKWRITASSLGASCNWIFVGMFGNRKSIPDVGRFGDNHGHFQWCWRFQCDVQSVWKKYPKTQRGRKQRESICSVDMCPSCHCRPLLWPPSLCQHQQRSSGMAGLDQTLWHTPHGWCHRKVMDGWCILQTARWWFTWFHPQTVAPEVTSQKQRGHATRAHCRLHSNIIGWIWRQTIIGEYPAPMDTPLPWSTPDLDLGHRSSISFYRRSRQDCVACHGTPVRTRTSPTICWQMRRKSMSSMHQNYQDNRTCHVALWHHEQFCRFGQYLSYWCKYEHTNIDTI